MLTQIQLPEGNVITNSYDNKKIISQNIGSTGQSLQVLYNEPTITQIIDENGITQDYEYTSEIDGLIQHILTTGSNFTYYYGDTSNPTKPTIITDGNNNDTMVDYDVMGNAVIIEKPYNIIHQFEYNAFNDVTLYTDPRGKQYQYGYDDNGNLTSIDKPDPFSSITLSYNIDGTINQITDPLSQATTFDYNQYGNVTNITDNLSHTTTYDYDDVSRLTSMTNANNQTTSYTYFNNDLLQGVTDANDNTTTYTYDDNDNLETVTNAENQTTTLTYNNKDLIESISNPLSQQTSYTYFDNGKLQTKTKPDGQTINYSYDDKGRLSNISGGTINGIISYDNNNNIVHINDNNGDIWFNDYDGLNRLEYYTDYYENEVHYNYDESSNITSIIYQDNKTVTYTYYDNNQLETVTDWNGNTTTYTYRADGTLQGIQYPNGINCSFEYDLASRLIGLRNSIGQDTINSYSYTLDDIGNHTSVDLTEPFSNPIISELNESYEYNDANQILSAGSVTFNHDENGNMTQRSGNTTTNYTWDILNRLTNVDVNNTSYVYDLFGNRCAVTENDVTTRYVLDINGPMSIVIMETDENGNVINYYIYGLGLISRIDANNNTNYYHYDSIGSTIAMTDENGIITHKYAYGPFGQVLQHEEEDDNSFRYVGKYGVMYEDNGLYFMRARYYNPQIGRFISEDPIWDFNLYAYGGNNPIIKIDPLGLTDQSLVIKKDEFNSEISAPKDPTVDDLTYWMLVELHETDVLFKYGNEVKLQETQVPSCNIFIAWEVYYGIPMAQAIAEEQVKTEAYEIFEKGGIESSKQEIHRIRLEYDESYRKAQGIYTFDEKISLWIYRNIWLPFKNSFK
ncbi:MAG: RHS repeat protein [Candidatus Cloacimonetes bacterium]|nr:RHS repeat protein [Candidatus Cloacimonadota bacterium]